MISACIKFHSFLLYKNQTVRTDGLMVVSYSDPSFRGEEAELSLSRLVFQLQVKALGDDVAHHPAALRDPAGKLGDDLFREGIRPPVGLS